MAFIAEHDYMRAEFDWLAVDSVGHLGFFASGGDGPVPQESIDVGSALEDIHEKIRAQPRVCEARQAADVEYFLGEFFDVAERGIFAYNWDFDRKEYRLVVAPLVPLTAGSGEVVDLAQVVKLAIDFSTSPWVPASGKSLAK